ncbi:MAG: TVP38/TMEM64 family protein [Lachnospiraceae bacterium]|nr:TVP38/TMEM64 family protein [Lachnospiraceae bacterium]
MNPEIDQNTKKRRGGKLPAMIMTAAVIAALLLVPASRRVIFKLVRMLGSADVEAVKEFIRSYGTLAALISMGLMILQSVAAPIPAFLITFANAAIFGWVKGAIISWTGAMLGAIICFGLARLFGRDQVVKITGKGALLSVDRFFTENGAKSVFIARLLPFVPFDPISYAAGLTGMKILPFLLATGLGQLPATIVYSYAGSNLLSGDAKLFLYGLSVVFALGALSAILKNVFDKKKNRKKE